MSPRKATSDLWWKNAVVYCLDVQTFRDSDGDGCGDFKGLSERIDYLAGLGVTCIWLMPVFPLARVRRGYDIVDFYAVDPRFGTLGDVVELARTASDRGIADLVPNHTLIRHPWFQSARSSPDSPYHDFYVWQDEKPRRSPATSSSPTRRTRTGPMAAWRGSGTCTASIPSSPTSTWQIPGVRDEIAQIAGFWLRLGLSGFRVDAVPFLLEPTGMPEGAIQDPHDLMRDLRAYLGRRRGNVVLLGEVNLPSDQLPPFLAPGGGASLTWPSNSLSCRRCTWRSRDGTPVPSGTR